MTTSYLDVNPHMRYKQTVYNYVTRPLQWLRKAVYDRGKEMYHQIQTPCAVMHVRRSDVILHPLGYARKYYAVVDYFAKLPQQRRKNVFLLTDDANAIDEAHTFLPNVTWFYFDRTRFRGSSGGWENQIPSNNPKGEVITILTTLKLVRICDTLVYGTSAFAELLEDSMRGAWKQHFQAYRVDDVSNRYNASYNASEKALADRLQAVREKGIKT